MEPARIGLPGGDLYNPAPSTLDPEDGTLNKLAGQLGVLLLVLSPGLGCSPAVRMPRLHNPGPAGYQRYNAVNYSDPYPLPDVGPEMDGARPREFQLPRPPVERARQYTYQHQQPQFVAPAPQPVAYPSTTCPCQ